MNTLYFAYGSNMNNSQMKHRCPRAVNMGPAVIKGWSLRQRLHADIDVDWDEQDEVHGVLWEVTPECVKALDLYEGCQHNYYYRTTIQVTLECGVTTWALVYIMTEEAKREREGYQFNPLYARDCAEGAEENGVPVHPLYWPDVNLLAS